MRAAPELVGGRPPAHLRPWIRAGVISFCVVQLLLPLRYYLGEDRFDERFSWRMFSAIAQRRCMLGLFEHTERGPTPLRPPEVVHDSWGRMMSRNARQPIFAFLEQRCARPEVRKVSVQTRCVDAGKTPLPDLLWERDCRSGRASVPAGARKR